jgi:catechol 2,3-dioxygenase-like lactoylglutathione lyase family enzyme
MGGSPLNGTTDIIKGSQMILAVHHAQVSIPKGSEDQARDFYCGVLQLKEIEKPDSLKNRGGFWLALGPLQIHFGAEDGVDRNATKAHLAYEVSDLKFWEERLQQHGTNVKQGIPIPGYNRFEFRDPFGNRIEFLERLSS